MLNFIPIISLFILYGFLGCPLDYCSASSRLTANSPKKHVLSFQGCHKASEKKMAEEGVALASVICIDLWAAEGAAGTAATCDMLSDNLKPATCNLRPATTCSAATMKMERCQGGSGTLPLLMCLRRHSTRCRCRSIHRLRAVSRTFN